jgi:hypothetical protein
MKAQTKNDGRPAVIKKGDAPPNGAGTVQAALVAGFSKKDEIEIKIGELQRSIDTLQRAKNEIARTLYARVGSGPFKWKGQCFQIVRRRGTDDANPEEGATYVFRGEGIRQPTLVG